MDILRIILCALLIATALSAPVCLNGVGDSSDETEADSSEASEEAGANEEPAEEEPAEEELAEEEPPQEEPAPEEPPQEPVQEPALVTEAPDAMLETAIPGNHLPTAEPDPAAIGLDNPSPLPDVVLAAAEDPQLSTDIDPSLDLSISPASPGTDNSIGHTSPGMDGSQNALLPQPALDVPGTVVEPLPIVLATNPQGGGTPPPSTPVIHQTPPPTSATQFMPVATAVVPNGFPVCFTIQFTTPESAPPRGDV